LDTERALKTQELNQALNDIQEANMKDVDYLYWRSFRELESVFKNDFQKSKSFKNMVLLLNQNMIEYKFLRQAGVLINKSEQ